MDRLLIVIFVIAIIVILILLPAPSSAEMSRPLQPEPEPTPTSVINHLCKMPDGKCDVLLCAGGDQWSNMQGEFEGV